MKNRKKMLSILLTALVALSLTACGGSRTQNGSGTANETGTDNLSGTESADGGDNPSGTADENMDETTARPVELYVFAAASLTEPLDEIIALYRDTAPNVTVIPTYDSSGTLKTQIQEGAVCDIFISAAQKQMNQLDAAAGDANSEGLDFVLQGTRRDLLENRVVLTVPANNPKDIQSFADLGTEKLELLCIGNEDVPVGAYSLELLTRLGILEQLEAEGKLTYGSNVKEVAAQVTEGTVDAGIVYATDAFSAGLTVVDEAGEDLVGPVVYPAAVLNITQHEDAARAFLDFLETDAAMDVFRSVGFAPAG
ncbi:MAG: molybdate ABC transporter substrate-binding protein [Oscillibacter sp.]|nr:molybdate ABC transporter substrate-binding protein [Oscillibacter sp.]